MVTAIWIIGALALLALAGVVYLLFIALPKVGKGMQEMGTGLQSLGSRFENFANFMATKLG